jgi:D-alanine-D-alanine ligase-like ATP-grasp enzyme
LTTLNIYYGLKLSNYARIEYRQRLDGTLVFMEANALPGLRRFDLTYSGLGYDEAIGKIVENALRQSFD